MKHHHYMKYLFVLLLFLPTSLMAQNKEEKTLIEQYRKKYQLKDSLGSQLVLLNQQTIGSIQTDSSRNICQIEINQLPTYKNLTHQLFGYTQTDIYDHVVETYQISPEDYYSFKDLLFQKSDNSYLFSLFFVTR